MTAVSATETGEYGLTPYSHENGIANEEDGSEQSNDRYLMFLINGEMFGIDILRIKEIIEYAGVSVVPMVPDHIRGVMNLRGNVVPVIDLGRRLGRTSAPVGMRTCVVIVEISIEDEVVEIGIVVDAVHQVVQIQAQDIEPAPPFGANVNASFIFGMGRVAGRSHILLDLDQVLDIEALSSVEACPGHWRQEST